MHRRELLYRAGSLFAMAVAGEAPAAPAPRFRGNPFTLGVASGDPLPDGVVLWTRLAPEPLQGGGMPRERLAVRWRIAADDRMRRIVRQGSAMAAPELAHSVHVEAGGLEPARDYWYQFSIGGEESSIGRTRTAPAPSQTPSEFRFAFASCQHFEQGLFTAFEHMAEESLDAVIHLGDYIYEGAAQNGRVRRHNSAEIESLADYRNRYALYRGEPLLQQVHARFPWIVTWDDHELDNNYAGETPEDGMPPARFLERRANAYQAYYEHMPLRRSSLPRGSRMQLYRALRFGSLAEFTVLDTRQYRTDQPCGDGNKPQCPAALVESATMLGPAQERWLLDRLSRSSARWNVIAQQVMMAKVDRMPGPEHAYSMDQWSGYEAARRRILVFLEERRPSNPVVITGDIHSNWVADLKHNWQDPASPALATEFVGTSISSGGDGADSTPLADKYRPENPHVRFFNAQRGYVRCSITPERWTADYRIVDFVTRPGSPMRTRASFVVENGRPGAQEA
jgi:alkaline phosphatase D